MPLEQGRIVIAPGVIDPYKGKAISKKPMTSKQVKKAYKERNKAPKMTKAQQRAEEKERRERERLELEREKRLERDKGKREQAKQKAEEEKRERKRAGIPERSRWVRASQPRISGFAGLGKRSREVSTGNEGSTTGMDDTTVAEEHRGKRANRESGDEDYGYNSHPHALNGDTTMPDNTARPSQIQIVVPSLPKELQQAYSSQFDADLSPDDTTTGEIEDTTMIQPVTKSPRVFTHEEVEETRQNPQSSQLEEAVIFETLIADETDVSIVVKTPPKAVPWVAPSPLRQSPSRLGGMEDSTVDCARPTKSPKSIDEQAAAKDGIEKSFGQLSPKRAPGQPKFVTKTPVEHQNPQFAASQDYFALMDDDDDDFNFDIPDFSTPKPPTATGKPAPVNALPKPLHTSAVSSPSPRRPISQASNRVVNKMMPLPRSTCTTPVQPPRQTPMQFAASQDYFAEMDLDDEDFIATQHSGPKRPLPQAPKSSVTKMMPPPHPNLTLTPQPPRSAPIQFEASQDYFAGMDLDDDDFAAVDLSYLAKPATLLYKPYLLIRQQGQLRKTIISVPKQQATRPSPVSILKASSDSIKPPSLKSGYYRMDEEFLYTETEESDATYKCRVMRNGTMRPPHINWLHVKTPLEAVDMNKLMSSGAKMMYLPNESRTTTPKSASKPSPRQTPVFKRTSSPSMRPQLTHDTASINEGQYHSPGIHFENRISYRSVATALEPSEGPTIVAHAVRNMDLSTVRESMRGPLLYLQDMANGGTAPGARKPRRALTKPTMTSPPKTQQQQTKAQTPTLLPQTVPQVFDDDDFDIPSGTQIERELADEYGPPKATPLQPILANTPTFVSPWIYPADLKTTTTRADNSGKKHTVSGRTKKEIAEFGETVPSEKALQPAAQNVLRVQPPEFQQNTSNTKSKHKIKPPLKLTQKPPPVPKSHCTNIPQRQPVVKQEPSFPPPEVDLDLGSFELPTSSQLEREMAEDDALAKSRATTLAPHPNPTARVKSMNSSHETRTAKQTSQSLKVPPNSQLGAQAKQSQVNNLSTVIELGDSFEPESASQLEKEIAEEDGQVRLRKPANLQSGDNLPPPSATSTAAVVATIADFFRMVSGSQIEREMAEEKATAKKAAEDAKDTVQPSKSINPNTRRQQRPNESPKQASDNYSLPISIDTGFQEKQLSEEECRTLPEKAAIAAREARRPNTSTQRPSRTPWVTRKSCTVTLVPRRQSSVATPLPLFRAQTAPEVKMVKDAEQQQKISTPTKTAGPPPQKRRFFIEKPADIAESAEYESRILAEQNAAKIVKAQAEQDAFLKKLIGSQAAKDALAEEQVGEKRVRGERMREQGEDKEGHGKGNDLSVLPKESAAQQPKRPITFDNDDEFDFGSDDIDWAGVAI